MFDINNIIKFVSLLTYIGFIISSITGFKEINENFNLCEMFVAILVFISNLVIIFMHVTEKLFSVFESEKNTLYFISLFMLICSFLVLGLSNVGIVFCIWGILMSIINTIYAIFLTDILSNNQSTDGLPVSNHI
jgi:hypothetical protein